MIKLLDDTRVGWFDYFYVFCMFIYAGSATVFSRSLGDIRTIGNAFALLLTVFFYLENEIKFSRQFVISIGVFLLYAAITSIRNHLINPFWISQWLIWLTIAYGICQGYGESLFIVVETVLYHLCIIGLVCWVIHLVNPELMKTVVKALEFSQPYQEDSNVWANVIIYTINNESSNADKYYSFLRNAGFAWEPGAFASFICLGIFCNLLRFPKPTLNRSLIVFLLALFSSQSTTGLSILLVMAIVWLALNKKYAYLLLLLPVGYYVFQLPFVSTKLMDEADYLQYYDVDQLNGAVGRFISFQLNFEEFLRHPIIGLGGYTEGTWLAQNYEIATISGIGEMLVFFGAIMTAVFVFLLIKSCKLILTIIESDNAWLLIVVVLGMMVSYSLWKQPIFIAFWLFGYYSIAPPEQYDYDDEEDEEMSNQDDKQI